MAAHQCISVNNLKNQTRYDSFAYLFKKKKGYKKQKKDIHPSTFLKKGRKAVMIEVKKKKK